MTTTFHTIKPLFSRMSPVKKLQWINSLSTNVLLNTMEPDILRCVKEAGTPITIGKWVKNARGGKDYVTTKSRRKTLYIRDANGHLPGNGWNSNVRRIFENEHHQLAMEVYIQGEDTDTTTYMLYQNRISEKWGEFREDYSRGSNIITAYYTEEDTAEVIRAILISYVNVKYADKLKEIREAVKTE